MQYTKWDIYKKQDFIRYKKYKRNATFWSDWELDSKSQPFTWNPFTIPQTLSETEWAFQADRLFSTKISTSLQTNILTVFCRKIISVQLILVGFLSGH